MIKLNCNLNNDDYAKFYDMHKDIFILEIKEDDQLVSVVLNDDQAKKIIKHFKKNGV